MLLIAQIVVILLPAFFDYLNLDWVATLAFTLVIVVSGYIVTDTRRELFTAIGLAFLAILAMWIDAATPGTFFSLAGNVSALAFFMYAGIKLAGKHLARMEKIDLNVLYAAISGFIFLGIIGGFLVKIIDLTTADMAFSVDFVNDQYAYFYYSFVTITTLGYGDILPLTPTAQAISVLLAISGQMYITVVIAVIVGKLIGSRQS